MGGSEHTFTDYKTEHVTFPLAMCPLRMVDPITIGMIRLITYVRTKHAALPARAPYLSLDTFEANPLILEPLPPYHRQITLQLEILQVKRYATRISST